jgi:hypothetical protein
LESTTTVEPSTTTSTSTATTVVPTCTNEGLQYAVYRHSFGNRRDASDLNLKFFKTATPIATGVTGDLSIFGVFPPYQVFQTLFDDNQSEFLAAEIRGFLYGVVPGEYIFNFHGADDVAYFWVKDKAYTGWTLNNADLFTGYNIVPPNVSKTVRLKKGEYVPFRIFWANTGGAFNLLFDIINPNGRAVAGNPFGTTPFLKAFTCDGSVGVFPPYGQE